MELDELELLKEILDLMKRHRESFEAGSRTGNSNPEREGVGEVIHKTRSRL